MNYLEFYIARDSVRSFTHDFTVSRTMAIDFPAATEPPWLIDLTGNSVAIDNLVRCVITVAGPADRSHPYAYVQPVPDATQPFARPDPNSRPVPGGPLSDEWEGPRKDP